VGVRVLTVAPFKGEDRVGAAGWAFTSVAQKTPKIKNKPKRLMVIFEINLNID